MKLTFSVLASFLLISISSRKVEAGPAAVIGFVSSVVGLADSIWNKIMPGEISNQQEILRFNEKALLLSIAELLKELEQNLHLYKAREIVDKNIDRIHVHFKEFVQCNASIVNKKDDCRPFNDFSEDNYPKDYVAASMFYFQPVDNQPRGQMKEILDNFATVLKYFQNFPKV